MKTRLPGAVAVALLIVFLGGPVMALDRGSLRIGADPPVVEKTYPMIRGSMPYVLVTPQLWRPSVCRTSEYCDVIAMTIDIPQVYRPIFQINIELSWTDPTDDVDLFVFNRNEGEVGRSILVQPRNPPSERFRMAEPEERFYYLVALHYGGVNPGYKFTLTYSELDLGPGYSRPERAIREGSTSLSPARKDPSPFAAQEGSTPNPELSPMKVPGPDGETTEFSLPVLSVGERAPGRSAGVSTFWILAAGLLAAAATAAGLVLFHRRRSEQLTS